ncbi:MAG: LytR C-terminal domain-containing protein [bacterium]
MDLTEVIDRAGGIVAIAAGLGILLLLPLYFSQRRDLRRLVVWMEREPAHPAEDVAASEVLLDRAESELEELLGTPPPPEPEPEPAVTPAQRVTSERPALERVTMERAALEPHPRWRRFLGTITQPRWMVSIALLAVFLGIGAIFGSELLLDEGGSERAPRTGAIDPAEVSVAVLNGTTVPGLGAKVGDDVEANGFDLAAVTTIPQPFDQTVVRFEEGHEREARSLAKDLGVGPVQPIDRRVQRLSEGADVVVIAGEDRASA